MGRPVDLAWSCADHASDFSKLAAGTKFHVYSMSLFNDPEFLGSTSVPSVFPFYKASQ